METTTGVTLEVVTTPKLSVRTVLGEKGRVVIPAAMREALGLRAGDLVDIRVENHELRISTIRDRIAEVQERMRKFYGPGRVVSDELSAERREAAARGE